MVKRHRVKSHYRNIGGKRIHVQSHMRGRGTRRVKPRMQMKDTGDRSREMSIAEFRAGYVDAHYPGLVGYAYQADWQSVSDGEDIIEDILKGVDWIEERPPAHPILHMKDGRTLYVDDSNDFPQPSDESPYEEEDEW